MIFLGFCSSVGRDLLCWSPETISFGGKGWGMIYEGWCINIRYNKNQGWKYKLWVITLEGIDFVLKENHSVFCLGMPDIFLIFNMIFVGAFKLFSFSLLGY